MGSKENRLIQHIITNVKPNEAIYRSNSGMAWSGTVTKKTKNYLTLANPRPFFGMEEGFPDTFGYKQVEITPDMVGQTLPVFYAGEVKATGDLRPAQKAFKKKAIRDGVIYEVVKCSES